MRSAAWPSPNGFSALAMRCVFGAVVQQAARFGDDAGAVGADEPQGARCDALGSLGHLAQHQRGNAQAWWPLPGCRPNR